jgi:putative sugar O-methyltransferase
MKYFTSINYRDPHPLTSSIKIFSKKYYSRPNYLDKNIINKFIYFIKKNKIQTINSGEWEWINKNIKHNFISALNSNDIKFLLIELTNFFKSKSSFGLISSTYEDILKKKTLFISDILKNIQVWEEFVKLNNKDYNLIHENKKIGSPYGIIYRGKKIIYDTPRHDYYAYKIINILKGQKIPTILEVGGGYGGLLLQLLKRNFKFNYINVDLPETLLTSYYYIKKKIGINIALKKKLNVIDKKIIFVPYSKNFFNEEKRKMSIDLLFNSNSFSEMSKDILSNYFYLINKKIKPTYILHQNSNINLFPESKKHIETQASDFNIDMKKYVKIFSNVSMFQGGSGRYREYLYKRLS